MSEDPGRSTVAAPRLEKAGTVGALIAAAACPVCFPKLALLGAAFGLGGFAAYERYALAIVLILVAVAWLGHVWAFRRHRNRSVLLLATAAAAALYLGYFVAGSTLLMQAALAGLLVASVWLVFELRRCARCAGGRVSAESPANGAERPAE